MGRTRSMSVVPHDVDTVLYQFDVLVKSRVHHQSEVEHVDALNWCSKHARGVAVGVANVGDDRVEYDGLPSTKKIQGSWGDNCCECHSWIVGQKSCIRNKLIKTSTFYLGT